jgi:hypothetical protein
MIFIKLLSDDDTLSEDFVFEQSLLRQYRNINKARKVSQKTVQHVRHREFEERNS